MKILIVSHVISLQAIWVSRALREQGNSVDLLCFDAIGYDENRASFSRVFAFDWYPESKPLSPKWVLRTVWSQSFWRACFGILVRIMWPFYDVICAQAEPNMWCFLGSWWFKTIQRIPLVYHAYDITSLMLREKDIPWIERVAERYLYANADAFVHKMDERKLHYLNRITKRLPERVLQFLPYFSGSDFPDVSGEKYPGSPVRLVYAGGIQYLAPYRDPRFTHDKQAEVVAAAGAELHVYPAPFSKTGKVYREQLAKLGAKCAQLHVHEGIPFGTLFLSTLATYDYGWMVERHNPDVTTPEFIDSGFGAKVFAYVAAGIPVIGFRDVRFVAEYIQGHGIGIVLDRLDAEELREKLRTANYRELRANTLRLRPRITLESRIQPLSDLLNEVAGISNRRSA